MDNDVQRTGLSGIGDRGAELAEPTLREQIIAEIIKLVRPEPTPLARPTIAELEKVLNSETTDAVNINPDGSIGVRPTTTTVGAVADAVMRIIEAERERYAEIADDWLATFGDQKPEHVSAQQWACDAVKDIADNIRARAALSKAETP